MPLSSVQTDVLRLLASHRDPHSFVAGGAPLNRNGPRYPDDIDIFISPEERVAPSALADAQTLAAAGYRVSWLKQKPSMCTAEVARGHASTGIDWGVFYDYAFFPTMRDEIFGHVQHPIDTASLKLLNASWRREIHDVLDLVTIHESIVPLGALIWAAAERSRVPRTPAGLIASLRQNLYHPAVEWRTLRCTRSVDPKSTTARLVIALDDAEAFAARMPTGKLNLLFLRDGKVVQPDPDRLEDYQTHAAQSGGHWPAASS